MAWIWPWTLQFAEAQDDPIFGWCGEACSRNAVAIVILPDRYGRTEIDRIQSRCAEHLVGGR